MGKNLAENFPVAKRIFEEADEALHFAISNLCFEGSIEDLQLTENTQPAILAISAAVLWTMQSEGFPRPDFVAGHSLGEYSALLGARSLSLGDAIQTVRNRGRYMQKAVAPGAGAMAAVIGADLKDIENACAQASQDQVCAAANVNSPTQVVIAGNVEAVDRASELLRAGGAKRVVKLNVSAPFHCALMMPAQERLALDLQAIAFEDLTVPLVTNVNASVIEKAAQARESLIRQVSSPVRWLESIQLLIREGVDTFVEVGPGKILTGLLRQINREVKCLSVEDAASLKTASAGLGLS
jgi:[acyl-carrier-protein] S-malonyltransferase